MYGIRNEQHPNAPIFAHTLPQLYFGVWGCFGIAESCKSEPARSDGEFCALLSRSSWMGSTRLPPCQVWVRRSCHVYQNISRVRRSRRFVSGPLCSQGVHDIVDVEAQGSPLTRCVYVHLLCTPLTSIILSAHILLLHRPAGPVSH
jgi:hypothetical protein